MSFRSLLSQKPGEIPIVKTCLPKFLILAYILLKIGYTWDVGTHFGMYVIDKLSTFHYVFAKHHITLSVCVLFVY